MAIKPTGHHVLVQPEKLENVDPVYQAAKRAGIEIMKEHTVKEQVAVSRGVVLAVGPTAYKDYGGEDWCQVGDLVAYVRHGGMYIEDPEDKENYLILNDEDIVAILKKGS